MADKKIILKKNLLTSTDSDFIDKKFTELIPKKDKVTVNEFFDFYGSLFYDIPRKGPLSHTALVNQSTEYIGNYEDPRDRIILDQKKQIDQLVSRINVLEQGVLQQTLNELTYTIRVTIKLRRGNDWPKSWSRVTDRGRYTHRLIFDDYVNNPKYIDNSYNYFRDKTIEFTSNSPVFTLWYTGLNDVVNNKHEVVWRTQSGAGYGKQTYSVPEGQNTMDVELKLYSVKHNMSYPSWCESKAAYNTRING